MLNHLMGQLPNASEHGYLIDNMLEACHWFMLILFVGWSIYFVLTLFIFHKSRNPVANYHGVRSHVSSHVEFSVVLIEIILLFGFAYPLWGRRVNDYPSEKDNPVHIRVIAQQFQWKFHYPGKDGKFGMSDASLLTSGNPLGLRPDDPNGKDDIYSPNELHLPVNRPAILEITSMDVIHSFSFPAMRIAQDAIPGLRTPIWFKPVKVGNYQVICAQLCGTGHYNMKADVIVQTEDDYNSWLKDNEPK
ncbi:MAG TPA: cupredoxin domain-containing protein [Chthoniobacteraceae bacterium]|nr:cupredoxin domain-containing protein [Chthoniobacteraceae bacterium]